jgi:hypothetical protein
MVSTMPEPVNGFHEEESAAYFDVKGTPGGRAAPVSRGMPSSAAVEEDDDASPFYQDFEADTSPGYDIPRTVASNGAYQPVRSVHGNGSYQTANGSDSGGLYADVNASPHASRPSAAQTRRVADEEENDGYFDTAPAPLGASVAIPGVAAEVDYF